MAPPPPISTANPNQNTRIGPKVTVFLLLLIPLSLIGLFPDAQAQTVTPTITGDPFTIGEGNSTLSVYRSSSTLIGSDNNIRLERSLSGFGNHNVDSSERLILDFANYEAVFFLFIPLDTTLGELHQTINLDDNNRLVQFSHNITSITPNSSTADIWLVIFDDDVITNNRLGAGTVVPLVEDGTSPGGRIFSSSSIPSLFNNTLADKNIGYVIQLDVVFIEPGSYPISLDFNTFESDGTPINHITRQSVELTPAQQTTRQNLVNAIVARQTAIDQQNVIVDYWSDSNNPFADDRTLAQARIDYANNHITQSTIQLNSYQAQLDRLTS